VPLPPDFWELLTRLGLAMLVGFILGWERERRDKPAGLKTHMMVALGAAISMVVSVKYASGFPENSVGRPDPLRVLQGIVGGVGFLGAGAIIQSRGSVSGITTAATIWLAAAIGAASGMGYYEISLASAILGLITLVIFGFLERRFLNRFKNGAIPNNAPLADESGRDETQLR
jgi:putative Mg2+ transporter-C (MgtC) family protein